MRLLSLAAVALLAGLVAVAVVERREEETPIAPQGAVAAGGGWYDALAAPRPPAGDAERTSCGLTLTARSLGLTHPALPCGAKLLVRYGGETILTEVIDNELQASGPAVRAHTGACAAGRARRDTAGRMAVCDDGSSRSRAAE